jgi:hypothetical protein
MQLLTGFWGIVECGMCLSSLLALGLVIAGLVIALGRKERRGWVLFAVGSVVLLSIAAVIAGFVLLLVARGPR